MRPAEVVRRGADYLARHGVEASRAEAEALMLRVLRVDRATMFTREMGLSTGEAKAYGRALCRRCTGTPLQHLTGEQVFRGLVLEVRAGVFVPRPETEVLVEVALGLTTRPDPVVVDLCTGSGAVALSMASERPGARVFATDLSDESVVLAKANAHRLGLTITVERGDLFGPLPNDLRGRVDVVVANPPYVPTDREAELAPEVRAEPALALFGDPSFTQRVFVDAVGWMGPLGAIAVEIEETTSASIVASARAAGFVDVRVHRDLAGRDRVVSGRMAA